VGGAADFVGDAVAGAGERPRAGQLGRAGLRRGAGDGRPAEAGGGVLAEGEEAAVGIAGIGRLVAALGGASGVGIARSRRAGAKVVGAELTGRTGRWREHEPIVAVDLRVGIGAEAAADDAGAGAVAAVLAGGAGRAGLHVEAHAVVI